MKRFSAFCIAAALSSLLCAQSLSARMASGVKTAQVTQPSLQLQQDKQKAPKLKEWTILVYANGNNNFTEFIGDNINKLEKVGSNSRLTILAQVSHFQVKNNRHDYDTRGTETEKKGGIILSERQIGYERPGDKYDKSGNILLSGSSDTKVGDLRMPKSQTAPGTYRYYITRDGDQKFISSMQIGRTFQADAGSEKTLRDFLVWGRLFSPAKRYMVIIFNHGAGYRGVSYDDAHNSSISPDGVARAVSAMGGADVLVMGACLMQMSEVAARLKDSAGYLVGAEEIGWGAFYSDLLFGVNSAFDARQMASFVAKNAHKRTPKSIYRQGNVLHQTSVLDLSAAGEITPKIEAFAQAMMKDNELEAARFARDNVQRFSSELGDVQSDFYQGYCDLFDYARLAAEKAKSEEVKSAAADLMRFIDSRLVVANHFSEGYKSQPHGVSIYMPVMPLAKDYASKGLPNSMIWLEFIEWVGPRGKKILTLEDARKS